jgi:SAM-dependent methyltransferase
MNLSTWLDYWNGLADAHLATAVKRKERESVDHDHWAGDEARRVNESTRNRPEKPAILAELLRQVGSEVTVVDIGAGTGAWAIPIAQQVRQVTAVDASSSMLDFLEKYAEAEGLRNIACIHSKWQDAAVEPHDVAFCCHSIYVSKDVDEFLLKMDRVAKKACFIITHVGAFFPVFNEVWTEIRGGERGPDPDYLPIYNILYHLGIYAEVRMIETRLNPLFNTFDDAVSFCLDYLLLENTAENRATVEAHLAPKMLQPDGQLVPQNRAAKLALISWTKS